MSENDTNKSNTEYNNKHLDQNIGILLFIYKQNQKIIFIINLHMLRIYKSCRNIVF